MRPICPIFKEEVSMLCGSVCTVFTDMRVAASSDFKSASWRSSTRTLWVIMLTLQTKRIRSKNGKRIVLCDNFYTSIDIDAKLQQLSNNEVHLCGTVRLNNMDS